MGVLAFEYFTETLADFFNLKNASLKLPAEFEGVYNPDRYRESQQYLVESTRFEKIQRATFLVLILGFLFLGGFGWVDQCAQSLGKGSITSGLLFMGALGAMRLVLGIPFSVYSTFVIEAKFGFNRTTPKIFIQDWFKGLLLGTVFGGLILTALLYFFETAGSQAWLISWIGVSGFQLILSFLAPILILPLFNRFEPIPAGALQDRIRKYADGQKFKVSGIFTMDGSKRSSKSNAFFTGFGKFRRLVLFDTLIQKQTEDELISVLAHEIGHFKKKHILKGTLLSLLASGIVFWILGWLLSAIQNDPQIAQGFGLRGSSIYAGLFFAGILFSPLMRVFSILSLALSRQFEFEADEYAVRSCKNPEAMISALKKLSVDHLANLTPHPIKILLHYSHPPVLARIRRIATPR